MDFTCDRCGREMNGRLVSEGVPGYGGNCGDCGDDLCAVCAGTWSEDGRCQSCAASIGRET